MRKRYIKAIKRRIFDYVAANYQRIGGFVMGDGMFNYKCHVNAVQRAKEGKAVKVYACIAVYKNDWSNIVVHFINQLDDGTYQDNTWGWEYDQWRYYLVKEVHEDEFNEIEYVLEGLQKTLVKDHSSAFLRKLLRIETIV